jgi:hypothetical protein
MGPFFGGCAFLLKNTCAVLVCIPLGTCLDLPGSTGYIGRRT